jgi:ParB-like chromosome segregation protein Spo0J
MKQKLEYIAIGDLKPYEANSRTHSAEQVQQIARSIEEFGFTNPVLIDQDNGIIAGHGRVEAAKQVSMDLIPCIRLSHLSEAQKRAYVIADNKLALNAGWDDATLRSEIEALQDLEFDIALLGFNDVEMQQILSDVNFDPATEDDQGKLDQLDPKWIACPHCGKEFDLREQS